MNYIDWVIIEGTVTDSYETYSSIIPDIITGKYQINIGA